MDYTIAYVKSPHADRLVAINASGNRYYLSFSDCGEHVGACSKHFRSLDAAIERFNAFADHIIRHNHRSDQLADWIRCEGEE